MAEIVVVPKRVELYDDPSSASLDLRAVAAHVVELLGIPTHVRTEFLRHHEVGDFNVLASEIAKARVTDLSVPLRSTEPPPALLLFERRQFEAPERRIPGVLYDGLRFQRILRALLPPKERTLEVAHVVFTPRLLGTFDDADRRYHARAVVLGYPSIVSTSGLVEAPAKPREFYVAKRGMQITAADARYEALKETFAGRFLDFDDARLTQVAKGYALQAIFYQATGEPFCDDEDCVLFNAHWQKELLHAQIASGILCPRHEKVADRLRAAAGGTGTRPR